MVEFYVVCGELEGLVVCMVVSYVICEEVCVLCDMLNEDCKLVGDFVVLFCVNCWFYK